MGLREAIEGKERRRVVVPVRVRDVDRALARLRSAQQALADAGEGDDLDALAGAVQEAQATAGEAVVHLELVALPYADAEVIARRHTRDYDGSTDWLSALPVFLAAMAVDEDLRDIEWWTAQLARDAWAKDDVDALILGVMHLTADVISPRVPKG